MLLACGPSATPKQADTTPAIEKDNIPPALSITQPADNSTTDIAATVVKGMTEIDAKVTFNGTPSTVGEDGSFSGSVSLVSGKNTINVIAVDLAGNKTEKVIYITYNPPPPPPPPVVQQAPASQTQEATVYITKTGECYHSAGCRYLSKSCIPISLSAAKQSYRP